jgi:hypothetical protein
MDPEEALGGDALESLIERQDDGAEVTGSGPGRPSPPQDLDVVVLAGRAKAGHGTAGPQAVQCVATVVPHDLDAAAGKVIGRDPLAQGVVSGGRHRDLLNGFRLLCDDQPSTRTVQPWCPPFPGFWPSGCGRSPACSEAVRRCQALTCSITRRFRRRARIETKTISMKATRCSFVRSKIVFNRR